MSAIQHGKMKAIIEEFDAAAKALKLIYLFADFDILPLSPEMEISAELWEQYKHIWLDCIRLGIEIEIAAGTYTDSEGVSITLEERYICEYIEMPDALIPKQQLAVATVIDVDSFINCIKNLFVYTTICVTYRAQSKLAPTIPNGFIPVSGGGNTNWFVPPIYPFIPENETGMMIAYETQTPANSGYPDFPYNFFTVIHPSFLFYFLNYNLQTAFTNPGVTPLYVNVWGLDPEFHCPETSLLIESDDMIDELFKKNSADTFGVSLESLSEAGLLFYGNRDKYYCSWVRYQHNHAGCPYNGQYYYVLWNLGGDNRTYLRRAESCWCYGRPGTNDRPLTPFLQEIPSGLGDWFENLQKKNYVWMDDTILDNISAETVYHEWLATGGSYVSYNHAGGMAGTTKYPEILMIDRLIGVLYDYGINPSASSGQPFRFFRYNQYNSNRQEGTVTLLGYQLPEDYKVYYGGRNPRPGGGLPPAIIGAQMLLNGLLGVRVRTKEEEK